MTTTKTMKTTQNAIQRLSLLAVVVALAASSAACTHPRTPEGHEGYIYHIPLVIGKAEYRKTIRGPASTGLSWRLYAKNVDMRAKSFQEEFDLLSSDNLDVEFEVNTRIRLRPGSVQEVVEEWGEENWYPWNVKEPLRTAVRSEVTRVSAIAIQLETDIVRQRIFDRLTERYADTPIEILSVDIGNIRFPEKVTKAIGLKIAKEQELQRQEILLAKARKEAAINVLEALKVAKQQRIISSTLDPIYVQRLAVQVYRKISKSDNKSVILLPSSSQGTGLPLVLTEGRRKQLSPADEKLLEDMETRYMAIASQRVPPEPSGATPGTDTGEPAAEDTTPQTQDAPPAQPEPSATPPATAPAE